MPNHKAILLAPLLAFAFVIPAASRGQTSAADHFARGKKLAEDNCIDCMDGTQ